MALEHTVFHVRLHHLGDPCRISGRQRWIALQSGDAAYMSEVEVARQDCMRMTLCPPKTASDAGTKVSLLIHFQETTDRVSDWLMTSSGRWLGQMSSGRRIGQMVFRCDSQQHPRRITCAQPRRDTSLQTVFGGSAAAMHARRCTNKCSSCAAPEFSPIQTDACNRQRRTVVRGGKL